MGCSPWGRKESDTTGRLHVLEKLRTYFSFVAVQLMIAQLVKNPPAMQETLVQFLGREDPLEKR